jgi:hypothetical protein
VFLGGILADPGELMRVIKTILITTIFLLGSIGINTTYLSATSNIPNKQAAKVMLVKRALRRVEVRREFHRFMLAYFFNQWLEALVKACGGDLPPCYIMWRESKGNIYAVNPGHMGAPYGDPGNPWTHASGKWQFMPSTWNHYKGYPYAAAAPASVQNAKARELWAGGAGASHWAMTL